MLGCEKPANVSEAGISPAIPAMPSNEVLVEEVSKKPLVKKAEENKTESFRFDREDPNQLRIGSAINAVLRKRKNEAKAGSRGLKLVPSRAVPVLLTEEIKQIQELDLTGRELSDIACLSQLTHFTSLYLSDNRLSRLQPLTKHDNLLALTLDENQLDDLDPLRALTRLNLLSLDSNLVSDLKPLAPLIHLKYLYLGNNRITQIDPLENLENLVALDLSANQITDLDSLQRLTKLQSLGLFDNENLTLSEITKLQQALPGCTINHNVGEGD